MLTGIEPFFVFLFVVIAIIAIVANRGRKATFDQSIAAVAKKVGGTYEPGRFMVRAHMRYTVHGRSAQLEFFDGSKNSSPYTRVEVDLRGRSPGAMRILQEGFGQGFLKMFGAQDIHVGNRDFDALYVVKATPESLAGRIFRADRRDRVCATVRALGNFPNPTIDLTRETLTVQIRDSVIDEPSMMKVVQCANEFLAYVLDLEPDSGITWVEHARGPGGQCQVCGTEMKSGVVYCARCRTPHHGECWTYMGSCSTYGCRETRSTS